MFGKDNAKIAGIPFVIGEHSTTQNQGTGGMPNGNNNKNFSRPLIASLLNTENGKRRTNREKPSVLKNINTASVSLSDIIHGKLSGSRGVITGTMTKSMKILSKKTPTDFVYFETKTGKGNETQQV